MFFSGIGEQVRHQELISIASDSSFVYTVENFNSLYSVLKRLVHFDCDGNYGHFFNSSLVLLWSKYIILARIHYIKSFSMACLKIC